MILNISYDLKHSFVSCILKKTLTQSLFVVTNRILMAEKPSPDLSSYALREGKKVGLHPFCIPGYKTEYTS